MANLLILTGARQGETLPLTGDLTALGRESRCDIVLDESMIEPRPGAGKDSISRRHACVRCVGGKYYLEDGDGQGKPSRAGTYLNNQPVPFPGRVRLRPNDRIRICDFACVFRKDAADAAFLVTPNEEAGQRAVEALSGPGGAEQPKVTVVHNLGRGAEEECRRLRGLLESSHVFYERAEVDGLDVQLATPGSAARQILGAGFHRLVLFDARTGLAAGRFNVAQLLRHVYDRLVAAFDLPLRGDTYHPEDLAQVLKDEPRSLLCFLNLQCVPQAELGRLRGFTQELHQVLFLYRGERDLDDEPDWASEEADSVEPCLPAAPLPPD
jgi:pSer/pThr/pTyr-binding forkhead associated (FHA) protein